MQSSRPEVDPPSDLRQGFLIALVGSTFNCVEENRPDRTNLASTTPDSSGHGKPGGQPGTLQPQGQDNEALRVSVERDQNHSMAVLPWNKGEISKEEKDNV